MTGAKLLSTPLSARSSWVCVVHPLGIYTVNKKTKILVIDDSASVRASLGGMLPSSADIIEASNGLEGLKQVQSHRPNLILLDCQMPEMDGIEVFRRLQKHPHFCRIPVVMMSACADEVLPLLEEQPYAFEFLSKPFKPAQLLKASHEAMKRAKGMKGMKDVGTNAPKDSPATRSGTTGHAAKTALSAPSAAPKSASPSPSQFTSATTAASAAALATSPRDVSTANSIATNSIAANSIASNSAAASPTASNNPAAASQINETPLKSVIETLQRDMKVMQGRYRILEAELKQMRQFIQNASGS